MLEIKNLTKVYKTKGGAEVRALDGVSVRFEEKGMIFLLGKSGSGKSTLLNLCGGLDAPDSGEIIIKGRSSKDFTQSDFDSYRNTFVGFVFQEYNILNEFSVEDNIALALELQGKNKDKNRVREILEQVEMESFARRKPNTLSGGQKQRIAIARALVKNPEIIMADEPTGALDSNTGKQVFDTLKKLSEEKLVIVVSHDREFAEIYGDRIIELKDGKIISDVSKAKIAARSEGENLAFIGDDTISVKSGAKLSDGDMEKIRRFLASADGNVIITGGKEEIEEFRKSARIDENGAKETFKNTVAENLVRKQYAAEESRFIRSKLPARHALRIGANSLKVKPFRLIFTILLSFIAFTMFGLFSTLTFYDEKSVALESYALENYETLTFTKRYNYQYIHEVNGEIQHTYESSNQTNFTPADVLEYSETYGAAAALFNFNGMVYNLQNIMIGKPSVYYGTPNIKYFAEVNGALPWTMLTSETDLSALGDKDVVISSFMFDMIKHYGFIDDTQLNEYSDIIGKRLEIPAQSSGNKTELIVKGVYQNAPAAKYDVLKEDATNDLSQEYQYIVLESGIYNTVLVSDGFYDANVQLLSYQNESAVDYGFYSLHQSYLVGPTEIAQEWDEQEFKRSLFRALDLTSDTPVKPKIHFYGGTKTELADGEIVCSIEMISSYYERLVYEKMRDLEMQGDYDAARVYQDEMYKNLSFLNYGYYSVRNDDGYEERVKPTEQDYAAAFEEIEKLDEEYGWNRMMKIEDANSGQTYKTFKLAGFIYGARDCSDAAYFSPSDFKDILAMSGTTELSRYYQKSKYVAPADAVYNKIVVASPDRAGLKAILDGEKVVDETDDTFYALESDISNSLTMINDTIEMLSTVFLWVGVVMAVFAMLLLFNFISVSITYKKREIGILRAVGARSTDVFKIFYSESAIIAIICLVLSFVTSFIVCGVLNNMLAEGLRVAIFVFGPYSWLIMLGIAIVTSLIATFLPVYGIAKKKPVESIRSL